MSEVLDCKPYIEYDPVIGYRYTANTRQVLPRPGGGTYEIAINAAGIRSSREYTKEKAAGVFRILIFGDSYAAGQFVSNEQRFSELLERQIPNLEVINFALEGTGTDQQLLIYERTGSEYEHDLVLIFPFLQNIRRNLVEARVGYDPATGETILRAKPRFVFNQGQLELRNVPVPVERLTVNEDPAGQLPTDHQTGLLPRFKSQLSQWRFANPLKRAIYAVKPWEPFPEYRHGEKPEWQLMAAIIRRFKNKCGQRPLVLVPVFYNSYVRFKMARNYWDRFSSLREIPGTFTIDLLPHFKRLGREAGRAFFEPLDCHFSPYGHLVVADALQVELSNLGLISAPRLNQN